MMVLRSRSIPRPSLLDALTVVVLLISLIVFLRPGAPIRVAVSRWVARRHTEQAAKRHWGSLAATAAPLYDSGGGPEIIEFSDYECPFCRAASGPVDSAVSDGLRIAVVQLPLPVHPQARVAALAAICASLIGRLLGRSYGRLPEHGAALVRVLRSVAVPARDPEAVKAGLARRQRLHVHFTAFRLNRHPRLHHSRGRTACIIYFRDVTLGLWV